MGVCYKRDPLHHSAHFYPVLITISVILIYFQYLYADFSLVFCLPLAFVVVLYDWGNSSWIAVHVDLVLYLPKGSCTWPMVCFYSFLISDIEHFFIYLLAISMSSLKNSCLMPGPKDKELIGWWGLLGQP